MSPVLLTPVRRADATELVRANLESRAHHEPWVQPFTSLHGFEDWFGAQVVGSSAGFVARDCSSGHIVGVTNLSQIFLKGFRNAYLSYYGMAAFAYASGLDTLTPRSRSALPVTHGREPWVGAGRVLAWPR